MERQKRKHLACRYTLMVLSVWGKHISGPIFAVLSIGLGFAYAHYANNAIATAALLKYAAWVSGGISASLIFVAQYDVWKAERDKYDTEVEKNSRPEIRGAAFHFGFASGTVIDGMTPPRTSFPVAFELNVSNHRNVTTNIVDIGLDGSNLVPPVEFYEIHSKLVGRILEFGIGVTGMPVYARAQIDGIARADIPSIKMDNLLVYVQDGFMDKHSISVNRGEEIRLQ
jgi:hypothetical protein